MFGDLTPKAHALGRAVLHDIQNGFVLPSLDAQLFGRRALRLQRNRRIGLSSSRAA
jgi:hypothetical protein